MKKNVTIMMFLVIAICVAFIIPSYAYAETPPDMTDQEVVMTRGNISLVQRTSSDGEVNYAMELESDCQMLNLIFFEDGFAVSTIDQMVVNQYGMVRVYFQVGPEILGHVDMGNLFIGTLVRSNDQEVEVAILKKMLQSQEVMFILVDCETEPKKTFAINLTNLYPVCDEFFKLLDAGYAD